MVPADAPPRSGGPEPRAADHATAAEGPPARPRRAVGPFGLRQVGLVVAVVVLASLGLNVVTAPIAPGAAVLPNPQPSAYLLRSAVPGLRPGDLAPELEGSRGDGTVVGLLDLDGRPLRLADLRGRVIWLNFWASWCPPCQSETPVLRELDETYRDRGLVMIGIQVQETVDDGRRYAETYGLRYAIGADLSADIFRAYRVFALPTQFVIDTSGVIRAVVNGPVDVAGAGALIEPLLPPAASPTAPAASTPPR